MNAQTDLTEKYESNSEFEVVKLRDEMIKLVSLLLSESVNAVWWFLKLFETITGYLFGVSIPVRMDGVGRRKWRGERQLIERQELNDPLLFFLSALSCCSFSLSQAFPLLFLPADLNEWFKAAPS